jgi:hypothetical protein
MGEMRSDEGVRSRQTFYVALKSFAATGKFSRASVLPVCELQTGSEILESHEGEILSALFEPFCQKKEASTAIVYASA